MSQIKKYKKVSLIILLTFIISTLTQPYSAQAQGIGKMAVSTNQVGSALIGCLSPIKGVSKFITAVNKKLNASDVGVNDTKNSFREACLNKIGYLASRLAIKQITNRTVAWINTGFDGNPFWTTEDQTFYNKIRNTQIRELVEPYANPEFYGQTGQIFAKQIARQLILETRQAGSQSMAYTGPGRAFTTNFQSGGGWTSWMNLTQNPANDPLGFALLLSRKKDQLVTEKINEKSRELQTNNGFLSQKKCVNPTSYKPLTDFERKQALGDSSVAIISKEDFINNFFNQAGVSRSTRLNPVTKQFEQDPRYAQTLARANNEYDKLLVEATKKAEDAKTSVENSKCLEWKTVTPGRIISEQLSGALGSPLRQAELADNINEGLSAVFDALLNQLAQKGLNSLSQKSTYNYKSMFPTNDLNFNNTTDGKEEVDTGDYWQNQGNENDPFKIRALIPETLNVQEKFLNILADMTNNISIVLEDTGELDYCVPGPTPNWRDAVETAINNIVSFSYSVPKGVGRDDLLQYIEEHYNVNVFNDNQATVGDIKDEWLNGSTNDKIKKIKEKYEEYDNLITSRYENQALYNTPELSAMWNLRQKVVSEIDRYDEFNQAIGDNTNQTTLTGEATENVRELKPKYDALFAEVCANPENENNLTCLCDIKLHNDLMGYVGSPSAYYTKYYPICKNAGRLK